MELARTGTRGREAIMGLVAAIVAGESNRKVPFKHPKGNLSASNSIETVRRLPRSSVAGLCNNSGGATALKKELPELNVYVGVAPDDEELERPAIPSAPYRPGRAAGAKRGGGKIVNAVMSAAEKLRRTVLPFVPLRRCEQSLCRHSQGVVRLQAVMRRKHMFASDVRYPRIEHITEEPMPLAKKLVRTVSGSFPTSRDFRGPSCGRAIRQRPFTFTAYDSRTARTGKRMS